MSHWRTQNNQSPLCMSVCVCVCVCVLPDVKCALLCGAERCGAGTDTAGHHLFPQVMDLRLETTVLYTQTHTHNHCYDQADFGWQVLKMKLKQTTDISNISSIYKPLCFDRLCSLAWKAQHVSSKQGEKYFSEITFNYVTSWQHTTSTCHTFAYVMYCCLWGMENTH